jgi:hypothetical protein
MVTTDLLVFPPLTSDTCRADVSSLTLPANPERTLLVAALRQINPELKEENIWPDARTRPAPLLLAAAAPVICFPVTHGNVTAMEGAAATTIATLLGPTP